MTESALTDRPERQFSYVAHVALPLAAALEQPLEWRQPRPTIAWAPIDPVPVRAGATNRGVVDRVSVKRLSRSRSRVRLTGYVDDGVRGNPVREPAFCQRLRGVISLKLADGGQLATTDENLFAEPLPDDLSIAYRADRGAVHVFYPGYATHSVLRQPLPITRCGERVYWNTWHFSPFVVEAVDCGRCAGLVVGDVSRVRVAGGGSPVSRPQEGPGLSGR